MAKKYQDVDGFAEGNPPFRSMSPFPAECRRESSYGPIAVVATNIMPYLQYRDADRLTAVHPRGIIAPETVSYAHCISYP
ncbi:hypothetical protein [Methylomicrobium lacus]|uniref:hypothetical protein n=1 Tax=Methylomicrobium lacus TaxID=136992 RepID=UPI0035A9025C